MALGNAHATQCHVRASRSHLCHVPSGLCCACANSGCVFSLSSFSMRLLGCFLWHFHFSTLIQFVFSSPSLPIFSFPYSPSVFFSDSAIFLFISASLFSLLPPSLPCFSYILSSLFPYPFCFIYPHLILPSLPHLPNSLHPSTLSLMPSSPRPFRPSTLPFHLKRPRHSTRLPMSSSSSGMSCRSHSLSRHTLLSLLLLIPSPSLLPC